MSNLPRHVSRLAGIFAFCGAVLIALIKDSSVGPALLRGALCGVVAALVGGICTRVAIGVVHDGVTRASRQEEEDRKQRMSGKP